MRALSGDMPSRSASSLYVRDTVSDMIGVRSLRVRSGERSGCIKPPTSGRAYVLWAGVGRAMGAVPLRSNRAGSVQPDLLRRLAVPLPLDAQVIARQDEASLESGQQAFGRDEETLSQ